MTLTPKDYVKLLEAAFQCNCDLDNWQPTIATGHSPVCRIHKIANARARDQASLTMTEPELAALKRRY